MAQLLPPPTPSRDFSRDDDSDSDASEDSAGDLNPLYLIQIFKSISLSNHYTPSSLIINEKLKTVVQL